MSNPYPPYTPEHRVFAAARTDPNLRASQVLEAAGWVPHDGTALGTDLRAQYNRESVLLQREPVAVNRQASEWNEAEPPGTRPLDRSAAFTALLELSEGFRQSDMHQGGRMITSFLADFYTSGGTNMYEYARGWTERDAEAQVTRAALESDDQAPVAAVENETAGSAAYSTVIPEAALGSSEAAPPAVESRLRDVTVDGLGWPTEKDTVSADLAAMFRAEPQELEL